MTRPGFEPGPPRSEASDKPLELWRGQTEMFVFAHTYYAAVIIIIISKYLYFTVLISQ
jgi:hypothetical protein